MSPERLIQSLRQGDDTYQGRGDGVVLGEVRGANGEDTLIGGMQEDLFGGGDDDDDPRVIGGDGVIYVDDMAATDWTGADFIL